MDQALLDGEAIVWPPNRLTLRKKLAFAIGGTPAQVSGTVIGFFLTPFLLDVVGMRALNVAHILLVARICDAFSDPLVGWLTDRTKSRCAAAGSLCLPPRHAVAHFPPQHRALRLHVLHGSRRHGDRLHLRWRDAHSSLYTVLLR